MKSIGNRAVAKGISIWPVRIESHFAVTRYLSAADLELKAADGSSAYASHGAEFQ